MLQDMLSHSWLWLTLSEMCCVGKSIWEELGESNLFVEKLMVTLWCWCPCRKATKHNFPIGSKTHWRNGRCKDIDRNEWDRLYGARFFISTSAPCYRTAWNIKHSTYPVCASWDVYFFDLAEIHGYIAGVVLVKRLTSLVVCGNEIWRESKNMMSSGLRDSVHFILVISCNFARLS